ncbi:hypothetical protein AAKU55_002833 [Oxalobacteraceae bacterium GrIS 1.11]
MRYLAILAMSLLLAACATTIRSDVTAFNQWPVELRDKTYAFEAPPAPDDTLEYRSYLNLVRAELGKLGLSEATSGAGLKVAMQFSSTDRPVRFIEPVDPFWNAPGYWPGRYPSPFHHWYGYRPFYDPFMLGPVNLRESVRHDYERQLRLTINGADGRKLFDVTVQNTSLEAATALIMPALVVSAFADFPGPNGVPRRVKLRLQ